MKSWRKLRPRHLQTRRWYDKDVLIEEFVLELFALYMEEEFSDYHEENRPEIYSKLKRIYSWYIIGYNWHDYIITFLDAEKDKLKEKYYPGLDSWNFIFEPIDENENKITGMSTYIPRDIPSVMSDEDKKLWERLEKIEDKIDCLHQKRKDEYLNFVFENRQLFWS